MRRVQLFEIEDQPWCPAVLREGCTAYITAFLELTGTLDGVEPHLRRLVAAHPDRPVLDLCSGSGGPAAFVATRLAPTRVYCTDLFPHRSALRWQAARVEGLDWSAEPVDATAVPDHLPRDAPRTLFNAFHHFRPPDARRILEDAVRCRAPIGIFEVVGRHWTAVPGVLGMPFAVMGLLPFMRPFRADWVPLTYVLPVLPLVVAWDGFVSCLRVYSVPELRELTEGLDSFEWDAGTFRRPYPGDGTYLVGLPRE